MKSIILPCLTLVATIWAENARCAGDRMPSEILAAIRHQQPARLEAYLASRADYVYRGELDRSPPPSTPNGKQLAVLARDWEIRNVYVLHESIEQVRRIGQIVGLDWDKASLHIVRLGTVRGAGLRFDTQKHRHPEMLELVIRDNAITLSLLVFTVSGKSGLRITGEFAVTTLKPKDRATLADWRPGHNIVMDRKVADMILDSHVTSSWFALCRLHGTHGDRLPAITVKLPSSFESAVIDVIVVQFLGETVRLLESGEDTLVFAGKHYLHAEGMVVPNTVSMVIQRKDTKNLSKVQQWSAEVDGHLRRFTRIIEKVRTYRSGGSERLVLGTDLSNHLVKVTFTDDIVSKVEFE